MASAETETWVNDQLHDILGISDKYISQYFIGLASKSTSHQEFLQRLKDTGTVDIDDNIIQFAIKLWNKFGLMKGIIHRLHSYPIKLPSEVGTASLHPSYRWFNGCHSFDEICCKIGITHQDLEKIENDPNVVVCWK